MASLLTLKRSTILNFTRSKLLCLPNLPILQFINIKRIPRQQERKNFLYICTTCENVYLSTQIDWRDWNGYTCRKCSHYTPILQYTDVQSIPLIEDRHKFLYKCSECQSAMHQDKIDWKNDTSFYCFKCTPSECLMCKTPLIWPPLPEEESPHPSVRYCFHCRIKYNRLTNSDNHSIQNNPYIRYKYMELSNIIHAEDNIRASLGIRDYSPNGSSPMVVQQTHYIFNEQEQYQQYEHDQKEEQRFNILHNKNQSQQTWEQKQAEDEQYYEEWWDDPPQLI